VAVTPDGQQIVTGARDGPARLWDAVGGRVIRSFAPPSGGVSAVAATPDGQRIITGGDDGTARFWDAASGHEIFSLKRHFGRVLCVAMTPDGQRLVTGSYDNTAKLWDAASGRELLTFKGHSDGVLSVAVTSDGQRLVTGSIDGKAKVWDMASGRELLSLQGHTGAVWSITLTLDGQRIVTGSEDGTVRLWDALTGRELLALKEYAGPVQSVAVTPDGRRLITASRDGTIKIRQAASPDQIALWARQDQETALRLAAWQRPVAGAPGFIQDWLILAPIALKAGQRGAKGLEREQLPGEANLQPRAGEPVRVDGREWTWRAYHGEEPVLDFNRFAGELSDHHVAYAVCYLISEREREDLLLQIGSDDQAKVYLNGQEVYKHIWDRGLFTLDPIGPVTLRKGMNVLVLKVVNEGLTWEGCARFVDPEDNPAQGLRVTLTPEP
jgi:WD40 repeat protein